MFQTCNMLWYLKPPKSIAGFPAGPNRRERPMVPDAPAYPWPCLRQDVGTTDAHTLTELRGTQEGKRHQEVCATCEMGRNRVAEVPFKATCLNKEESQSAVPYTKDGSHTELCWGRA